MAEKLDDKFYERADAHIYLSNDQSRDTHPAKVSASTMFGAARFNAWVVATQIESKEALITKRPEIVAHFTEQYRLMLEEHLHDYITHFDVDNKES